MIYTVDQIIKDIRAEEPKITPDQAMAFINKVHRLLTAEYVVNTQNFQILAVANTYRYSLDATVTMVRSANWVENAQSVLPLVPESTKDWDINNPNWRYNVNSTGTPNAFAVEEGYIYVNPIPNLSASGGFPYIDIYAGVRSTLSKTSNIPYDVPPDYYIEGAKWHWAKLYAKDQVQLYFSLWTEQKQTLDKVLPRVNQNYRPQITPWNDFPAAI